MTDTQTTLPPNTVVVADAGPARKRLAIPIPVEAVKEKVETSWGALSMEAAVPGFRRGRVPRALLERRFGDSLLREARTQLVADAYSKALEEHKLRPVGEPELAKESQEAELKVGKPFAFTVEVEVVPDFQLPSLEGVKVRRPVVEITEEMVGNELRRNQYRFGTPTRIEGPFKPLDRMLGHVTVFVSGGTEPFFENNEALLVVPDEVDKGRGQVLGLLVDDLGPRLEGRKVGDEITIETTGPEGHEREELRGAPIRVVYKVRDAERITPATPEELAERFGLGTVENLREQLKLGLERRRDMEQRAAMREQVFEHLAGAVDFALPEKLSENQVARHMETQRLEMLYRGMEPERVEQRLAEIRATSADDARRRLKLFFLLARIAEHFSVEVSEAEVNGRIAQIAVQRNMRPEQVRAELQRSNRLGEVALSIREAKAADRIIDKAVITDVAAADWNAEAEAKAGTKRPAAKASKGGKAAKGGGE